MASDDPDAVVMTRIAEGDREAMAQLVQRHQDRIIGLAYRLLGDRGLAEDAAQDVLIKVLRNAGRYRPTAKFTTWLYRIVVNHCVDLRRQRLRRRAEPTRDEDLADTGLPGDRMQQAEAAARVRRAVDALPERQRTAVILSRFEQLSHRQIAEATGWTESAVESLLVRAYARLRELLREM